MMPVSLIANTLRSRKIPSLHAGDLPTDKAGEVLVDELAEVGEEGRRLLDRHVHPEPDGVPMMGQEGPTAFQFAKIEHLIVRGQKLPRETHRDHVIGVSAKQPALGSMDLDHRTRLSV